MKNRISHDGIKYRPTRRYRGFLLAIRAANRDRRREKKKKKIQPRREFPFVTRRARIDVPRTGDG